jgi:hypothetical protein
MKNKKIWFKAKMYGWGWQPVTWQGWIITFLYTANILYFGKQSALSAHSGSDALLSFAIPFVVQTVFLLIICYARGERPRWRWGK